MSIGIEEGAGSDITRYIRQLELFHQIPFDASTAIGYYQDSREIDILRLFIAITVSRFTGNGYILVIIYGIIFGYFFSRNLTYIISKLRGKLKVITIALIVIFFLLNPIWNINGFRFWTATHTFLYGLLPFLLEGKKKPLLWCLATPFVFHFAFFLPLGILGAYLFLGNRITLFYTFFIISLFISEINIKWVGNTIEQFAPTRLAERTEGYFYKDKIEAYQTKDERLSWHARYYRKGLHWSLSLLLIVLYWKSKKILLTDKTLLNILAFTYLLYGVANIVSNIPSGIRYLILANMLAAAFLAIYLQNNRQERIVRELVRMTFPLLVLFIIVAVRTGFYQMSITTLIGNPIFSLFTMGENIPLNTLIK